jgi:hypothetical protein
VGQLEALQAVAALSLLADNVQDRVNQLGALRVVALMYERSEKKDK